MRVVSGLNGLVAHMQEHKRHDGTKSGYLIKQFTVFFIGFAMVPLLILFYLYTQFETNTNWFVVSREDLSLITFVLGFCGLIGFFGMRSVLGKIVSLATNMKKSLYGKIDKKFLMDLVGGEGEVAELAHSFGQVFSRLEDNIHELEQTKATLHGVLSKVANALANDGTYDVLVRVILETAVDAIGAEHGAVFAADADGRMALRAWVGGSAVSEKVLLNAADPYIAWVRSESRAIVLPCLEKEKHPKLFGPPLICTPLIYREAIVGVLCISGNRFGRNFIDEEISIVNNLSYQIAIAFENAQLNKEMERAYFETMTALALAVEARDPYSRGHSERVGVYSEKLGRAMGVADKDLQTLRDASRLHDIGKIGITDTILIKPAALTEEERIIMKRHPSIGESIVMPLKTFHHLLEPIRHHHECLDGSGYPDGLTAKQIPLTTRIMVVADIYDALTSDRPYRRSLGLEGARSELDSLVQRHRIDADVVKTLYRLIDEKALSSETGSEYLVGAASVN